MTRALKTILGTLAIAFTFTTLVRSDEPQKNLPIEIELGPRESEMQITVERIVIEIRNERGIGGGNIKRTGGKWPETIVLRLHLKGLEQFKLINGADAIHMSASGDEEILVSNSKVNYDLNKSVQLDESSEWWISAERMVPINKIGADGKPSKISIQESGYFEITLPKKIFESNPESIRFQYIDFYRN